MITFSSNSMSSMGRLAARKARTVVDTSSASVHSGIAVETTYNKDRLGTETRNFMVKNLVYELASMVNFRRENLRPEFGHAPFYKITRLLLEHGIGIRDGDELVVTKSFRISDVCPSLSCQ
jgi:hypothetical protein